MAQRKCTICGRIFVSSGTRRYCDGPHYSPCPNCGKLVSYTTPSTAGKCCSPRCIKELSQKTRKSKLGSRRCKLCGKLFAPKQANQQFCSDTHTGTCIICNTVFDIKDNSSPAKTCSIKCQRKLQEQTKVQTLQDKYGVTNVSHIPEVKSKISDANRSDEVSSRRRATNLQKYGVDNPSKSEEVKSKLSVICSSSEYLANRETTCLGRYGYTTPMLNPDVQSKGRSTRASHYPDGYQHSREYYIQRMLDPTRVDCYLEFKSNPESYLQHNYNTPPTVRQLAIDLGVQTSIIYVIIIRNNLQDSNLISINNTSSMEQEVLSFLRSFGDDVGEIIQHDRTIIAPQELDFYIPKYNLAIECNPSSTHNSSSGIYGAPPQHYRYHQQKSQKASDAGVFLFHLFGYEWYCNQEVSKSILCNLLHQNVYKYGSRDTYVTVLSNLECNQFLNQNHRQGSLVSSVRLGLKLKSTDELIAAMTFNHLRPTIGRTQTSNDDIWELSRFCNRRFTTVHGSASKLFHYFLHIRPGISKIVSFSDTAHATGKIYGTLGFDCVSEVPPGYVWSNLEDTVWYNRVSCQKSNLRKLLDDDSIDIENQTEAEIMEAHKFVKVYDSGKLKWVYTC